MVHVEEAAEKCEPHLLGGRDASKFLAVAAGLSRLGMV